LTAAPFSEAGLQDLQRRVEPNKQVRFRHGVQGEPEALRISRPSQQRGGVYGLDKGLIEQHDVARQRGSAPDARETV
jgi:hypothetical protein